MISELMQPIISEHDVFVDINVGPLVHGKVEILDSVSNNFLTVYSYSDDEFVIATNPVILDVEGRPEQTIFCDRLCYLRVYSYEGLDAHNNPIYSFVRDFYAGHNAQSEVTDKVVGIDALKNVNPEYNTIVNVIGYHNMYDCQERTYIWDPDCVLEADNGYIFSSNETATGRWILQWDEAYIPSTMYGVYPGQETNVNALCSFIEEIRGKRTAPGIYFVPGHYTFAGAATTKKVLISAATQFDGWLDCSWVDVKGKPSTWIGDIQVSDITCPVYSSWYKSARAFWSCASKEKYCDGKNWTNDTLVSNISNMYVTFYTNGSAALVTNTGDYKLLFHTCKVVGPTGFLHRDSKVEFRSMPVSDKYFVSFNADNVSFNNTLDSLKCTFDADDFRDVANMALLAYKNGYTTIDMKNYYCGRTEDVDLSEYTEVLNLNANMVKLGKAGANVTLTNSSVNYLKFYGGVLSLDHSNVRLTDTPNLGTLNAANGSVVSGGWYLTRGSVNCTNSSWFMEIRQANDNSTAGTDLVFRNSTISSTTINSKHVECYDCFIKNAQIKVYPTFSSDDNKYHLYLRLERCNIDNTDNPTIQFTKVDGDNNCQNCWWNVRIIGNDFQGNALGITCPFWANKSWRTMFIARSPVVQETNTFDYNNGFRVNNNTGNCPKCAEINMFSQPKVQYQFNANWDPYITNTLYMKVAGDVTERIWLTYRATDGLGVSNPVPAQSRTKNPRVAQRRTAGQAYAGNIIGQQIYGWMDSWISDASFCLNTLDNSYTGTRDLDELDDWFKARIVLYDGDHLYDQHDVTDLAFMLG